MKKPTQVVGRRVGAFLIDLLLLYGLSFALFFAMADTQEEQLQKVLEGDLDVNSTTYGNVTIGDNEYSLAGGDFVFWLFATFLLGFLYLAVLQGIKGWTLGKLATGIRVVDEGGKAGPGVGKGALRWVMWIVDGFFFYLVALVTSLATEKNQRVGDLVAKTYVVGQNDVGRPPFGQQPQFQGGGYYPQQQEQQYAQQPVGVGAGGGGSGAGWHPDPQGQARLRYWDGSQWTEHTSN